MNRDARLAMQEPTAANGLDSVDFEEAGASEPLLAGPKEWLSDVASGSSTWTVRCLALVAAYVAIGYAVAARLGLPLHWPLEHLFGQAQVVFLVAYGPLLLAYVVERVRGPQARLAHLRERLVSGRTFFEFIAAMLAVHVTLTVFVNLKQYVPAIQPALYDSPLWKLDAWLHLGVDPAVAATEAAAAWGVLGLLDQAYLIFFPVQVVVPLLFLFAARLRPMRGPFFFSFCLLWMLGGAMYVLWPSLGPVYYWPSRFVWLDQAPYAQHLQWLLIRDYALFRDSPAYYAVKLYYGVAALPSLHVGMFTLFAIATWRWRPISAVLWALTLVTFAGSLALGWHYAVDGYAGALLAYASWWIGCRVCLVRGEPGSADARVRS